MLDDISKVFVFTTSGFPVGDSFFFKEISVYSQHIKIHWTVKLPKLYEELSDVEKNRTLFCTKYIHDLEFRSYPHDYNLDEIRAFIKKLSIQIPDAVFTVKGDHELKDFITQQCGIACHDLTIHGCPKITPPNDEKEMYPFCSLHPRAKCSYFKSARYYYWLLLNY
jgi:hypothetical protein